MTATERVSSGLCWWKNCKNWPIFKQVMTKNHCCQATKSRHSQILIHKPSVSCSMEQARYLRVRTRYHHQHISQGGIRENPDVIAQKYPNPLKDLHRVR